MVAGHDSPQDGRRLPHAIVVMGVSGSGKTTIGRALAARLGFAFRDGDEFHVRMIQQQPQQLGAGIARRTQDTDFGFVSLARHGPSFPP